MNSLIQPPVRRILALVAGAIGFGALLRRRRRRPVLELGPSPADDLRAKLAETRTSSAGEPAPDEPALDEPPSDQPPVDEPPDPGARRQTVHDRVREAIDELG